MYTKDLAKLTRHPDGRLGPDELADALEGAAYYIFGWEDLAKAWRAYTLHGNPKPLINQYVSSDTPNDDNEFAVYNAVQCTDIQWPTKWSRWKTDNDAYYKKYPFLTWSNAWFNSPCLYWGAKAQKPVTINGKATKSVLLIDETLDAATPYPGSLEVRKLYPQLQPASLSPVAPRTPTRCPVMPASTTPSRRTSRPASDRPAKTGTDPTRSASRCRDPTRSPVTSTSCARSTARSFRC